jgi:polyisoprenoid-binding protein YceI
MKTSQIGALLAGCLVLLAPAVSNALYAKAGESSVRATVSASAGISFVAKAADLRVADDGATVTFAVPVAALKTGIGMRDSHLREHLEESKFPDVTFSIARADVRLPPAGGSLDAAVRAAVTMHGVSRAEQVAYSIAAVTGGYRVHVEKLVLRLSDYGVRPASFAGVTVKNDVVIAADVPLNGE